MFLEGECVRILGPANTLKTQVYAGQLPVLFPNAPPVSFAQWFAFSAPLSVLLFMVMLATLMLKFCPPSCAHTCAQPSSPRAGENTKNKRGIGAMAARRQLSAAAGSVGMGTHREPSTTGTESTEQRLAVRDPAKEDASIGVDDAMAAEAGIDGQEIGAGESSTAEAGQGLTPPLTPRSLLDGGNGAVGSGDKGVGEDAVVAPALKALLDSERRALGVMSFGEKMVRVCECLNVTAT